MTGVRLLVTLSIWIFFLTAPEADAVDLEFDLKYLNTGDYLTMFDTGISYLESEVKRAPSNTNARFALGVLYFDRERYSEAKQQFEEVLRTNPNDAESVFYLGVLYGDEGKDEKFTELMEKVIQLKPTHVQAYNKLGTHYVKTNQFEKAKQIWTQAQQRVPNEESFYVNQAVLHWSHMKSQKDSLDVVINNLNVAIRLQPREQSFFILGFAYFMKEQYPAARVSLQKVLELNPTNVNALLVLANTYVQTDDFEKAIELAEKVQGLKPGDKKIESEIRDLKEEYAKWKKEEK